MESVFLNKLNVLEKSGNFKNDSNQIIHAYDLYSNQYIKASDEQKKWMDKNSDYILNKIRTLEKKY
ncbi:MAG: hypothetical protein GW839_04555 [Flavobacteriales bacterium]|nr:hypothetical protein [Flavobacteriia bacterium]NCP06138.1 hypothetical protein [Flavobacteriales bacterium]PIV93740.1 MAG: hypothetical protein COW44_07830 [Flavobacteriaceae bacterium CG17_big_fil_post_rev_8_21_14_2_50_33_15]PIY11186.1 MAG: hypothetical protein COZ17_07445 [Flavobacteriaceae bacterium CG_4_10_14_3_um_filter_33_47]PJB17446.1 MAG: hypothetical protein CO117_11595 [Flavobacteriaceae bacterium CG_4_9_14_3_um_filter_33_16]